MSNPRQANQDEVLSDFIKPWIANGREEERAAIVAWLREPQDESVTPWCELLADSIERGEHLRGDDA